MFEMCDLKKNVQKIHQKIPLSMFFLLLITYHSHGYQKKKHGKFQRDTSINERVVNILVNTLNKCQFCPGSQGVNNRKSYAVMSAGVFYSPPHTE